MGQSESEVIAGNRHKARESARIQLVVILRLIGLKNWREIFKPITKRNNRIHLTTFDSHLKTAIKSSQVKSYLCLGIVRRNPQESLNW